MKYELNSETDKSRTYINATTGAEVKTSLIYTDKDGNKYWGFNDLYKIPMIRIAMAKHISDLYSIGLSLKDILAWCEEEKKLIRSDDAEKYEKLYSMILEKERIAKYTADPIRQHLALCTVYVLDNEERVDYFDEQTAEKKLISWSGQPEKVGFFLSWHNSHIQRYIKGLNKISQIASALQNQAKQLP